MAMPSVVHLSHSDLDGGAAIAARRLNQAMVDSGLKSTIVTARQLSAIPSNASLAKRILHRIVARAYWKRYDRIVRKTDAVGAWSSGAGLNRLDLNQQVRHADVVYLHWVNRGMLSIEEIGHLLDGGRPVVWFLHDMWPMTGGCHYAFDCNNYQTHCGACPMLHSTEVKDASHGVFERKLKQLSNHENLTIVTPSRWLAECAKKSRLFNGKRIEVIPNVIDTTLFRPMRKTAVREILGLPQDRKIILFGCDGGTRNFYKGWSYLEAALKRLDNSEIDLLLFGQGRDSAIQNQFHGKVHFLGYLNDEFPSLPLAYNAADVFVSPSIAENFSQTLCEASACGTPCVCFDVGVNSDIVLHGKTGYVAQYKDSQDLAEGIRWVLENKDHTTLGESARRHIKSLCEPSNVVRKHLDLIDSLQKTLA